MHLSLRPLPGPARAPAVGLQGNVCRTKLGLLAMHLLGTAKQGALQNPTYLDGLQVLLLDASLQPEV